MSEPRRISRDDALRRIAGDTPDEAVGQHRCLRPPIGCGRPLTHEDLDAWADIERREYVITGLCKGCQV